MIFDRIMHLCPKDTPIPKPTGATGFAIKEYGCTCGARWLTYYIPNNKSEKKRGHKKVTESQIEKAYEELRSGQLTKRWWKEKVSRSPGEGGCTFTTVGGLFVLLGEAEYGGHGVYRLR